MKSDLLALTMRQAYCVWGKSRQREATMPRIRSRQKWEELGIVGGNGLLDRRTFLRGGAAFAAAMTGYTLTRAAAAEPLKDDPWSLEMGAVTPPLQTPSRFEQHVVRTRS